MVNWSLRYQNKTLPDDYEVTWETKPLFVDTWEPPAKLDPARESTRTTVLAQGLTNEKHTLTLVPLEKGKGLEIAKFQIFHPPLESVEKNE